MISFKEFILENFYVGDNEDDRLPLTEKEKSILGKTLQKEKLSIQKMEWQRSIIKDITVQKIVKQLKGRRQVFLLHTEKTVAIEGVPANCRTFLLCYDSDFEDHTFYKSSLSVQTNNIGIQSINLYAISESGQKLLGRHTTTTHNRRIIDYKHKKIDDEANENFDEIFKQLKKVKPDVYIGNIGKGYNGEADVRNLQRYRKMAQDDSVDPLKMREKNGNTVQKDRVDLKNLRNEVSSICKEYNSMIEFLSSDDDSYRKTKNAISPIELPTIYGTVTASNSDAFKKWFEEEFKPKVDMINKEIDREIKAKRTDKEIDLYDKKYRAADIALDKEKRHINTVFENIKRTYSNTLENHFYDNKSNGWKVKPSGRYSNVITPADIFIALNSIWSMESLKTEISNEFKTIKDFLKD